MGIFGEREPPSTSALQAPAYSVPVPTDELSYRVVKQGVDARVKWGKERLAPTYHEIHNKLFDALFAWLAK